MALTLSRNALACGLEDTCKSGPHASALRLKIYKVSANGLEATGMHKCTEWQTIRA